MKKLTSYLVLLFCITFFTNSYNLISQSDAKISASEFEILVEYLEANGNFINSDAAPSIVQAEEIKKNLKNPKYHIIDIRSDSWFEYGHIKDAANVKASELLTYFENTIKPEDFDKITLVCYSGQSAAYFAGLLRLAGYDNVYSMKWGMSSWRLDFAENSWLKNIKNDFADNLETTENNKAEKGNYPTINTGKTDAKEILKTQLEKAFATPYKESIVKSADVFENPSNYYIVNYWGQDKYTFGHIPGAIQYEPNGSLAMNADLATLPIDKKVTLYGPTGQETAYVVAYLNILGYDTGNIAYGANSFINKKLKENKWDAFTKKEVNTYPVIE